MARTLIDDYVRFGYEKLATPIMRMSPARSITTFNEFNEEYRRLYMSWVDESLEASHIDYVTCEQDYQDEMLQLAKQRRRIEDVIKKIDIIFYDELKVYYINHGENDVKVHKLALEKEEEEYIDDAPYRKRRYRK